MTLDRTGSLSRGVRGAGMTQRPRLGVVKFASCDGCQLTLLDLEDELLALTERFEIVEFPEATTNRSDGPYDVLLVEGSISTAEQAEEIVHLRRQAQLLVTIGACATAGGIQALRNWADEPSFRAAVYAHPEYVDSLATATPISDHVAVDAELRGCPIDPDQLVELLTALVVGRRAAAAGRGGVRRVQASRDRLRRGDRRLRLPRPGDPDRLRRALPGLRPGLLCLLRTEGVGQRAGPCPAPPGGRGSGPGRRRPALRGVHRLRRTLPLGRHRARWRGGAGPSSGHVRSRRGEPRCMTR